MLARLRPPYQTLLKKSPTLRSILASKIPSHSRGNRDRQGRGRLVQALRQGAVSEEMLASACGWPDDVPRAERITVSLVAEGFAEWADGHPAMLRLR